MADDACFVCFRSGRCDLDGAAKALAGLKLTVTRRDDELAVGYPGGPVLRVAFNGAGYVAEENVEIAQRNPCAVGMLPCDARFEVLIDDLDAALQEYSTLFAVQEALEDATGGGSCSTPGTGCFPAGSAAPDRPSRGWPAAHRRPNLAQHHTRPPDLVPVAHCTAACAAGYGWRGVVDALVRMKAPKPKKVSYDPETSTFVALSKDKDALKHLAELIRNAVAGPELLKEAINKADPELMD